jgi:ribosomal protein L10
MYARSGKQLKEARVFEVKQINGMHFPVRSEMRDMLKTDSKTVIVMRNVQLNIAINDAVFSKRYLTR